MLIDDNEIDNLINQKMIEASGITKHIFTHTGARSAIEFLKNMISGASQADVAEHRGSQSRSARTNSEPTTPGAGAESKCAAGNSQLADPAKLRRVPRVSWRLH